MSHECPLFVRGNLGLGQNSTVDFTIADSGNDQAIVCGTAFLSGQIAADFTATDIEVGATYTVMTFESSVGSFENGTIALDDTHYLQVVITANSVELVVQAYSYLAPKRRFNGRIVRRFTDKEL